MPSALPLVYDLAVPLAKVAHARVAPQSKLLVCMLGFASKTSGRIQRHAFVNDLIYRAMVRAAVPVVKEPQGLVRVDGKRSGGLTLVPWQSGRSASWDVTVVDTLAASYISRSAVNAASATQCVWRTHSYLLMPLKILRNIIGLH